MAGTTEVTSIASSSDGNIDNDVVDNENLAYESKEEESTQTGHINRDFDEKDIATLQANWQNVKSKYEWTISGNCGIKVFWTIYYIITGLLVFVLITLPFIAFELALFILIFLFWLLTLCCCCKHKSFWDYFRLFLGNERIRLCMISSDKRSFIWHIRNIIIRFYQFVETLVYFMKGDLTLYATNYRRLYGDIFPFIESIAISNYDLILKSMNDWKSRRHSVICSSVSNDLQSYMQSQPLDTFDISHTISKDIANIMCKVNNTTYKITNNKDDPNSLIQKYYEMLASYILDGSEIDAKDFKEILNQIAGAPTYTLPPWLHFLIFNNLFLRLNYVKMNTLRLLVIKYGGNKYEEIKKYSKKHKIDIEILLNAASTVLLFVGGEVEMSYACKRIKKNQESEMNAFDANKMNYISEVTRHSTTFPAIAFLTREVKTFKIQNKEYTFPTGTMMSEMLALANLDGKYFNDPTKFDSNRDYDPLVTFHTLDKYYDSSNYDIEKIAPRYCPGRWLFKLTTSNIISETFATKIEKKA